MRLLLAVGVLMVLALGAEADNPLMAMADGGGNAPQHQHAAEQSNPESNPLIDGTSVEPNKQEEASVEEPNKQEEASVEPNREDAKDPSSFYGISEKDAKQMEDEAPASPPTKAEIANRRAYNQEMRGMQLVVSLDHAVEKSAAQIAGDATEAMRPLTLGEVRNPLSSDYPGDRKKEKAAEERKIEKAAKQVHELAARFDLANMEKKARKAAIAAEHEGKKLAGAGADEHGADVLRKAGELSEREQDKADVQTKSIVEHAHRFDKASGDIPTATRELGSIANQAGLLAEGEMNTVDKVAESEADLSSTAH